jgi:predicted nucleotidyltransferase
MNVSAPYTAVCPTLDTEVLTVLAGTTMPLTGRQITRLTGRTSHGGVLDVLHRLADHGLVDRQEAGRALLFTLNREHLAAPAVDVLAGMRTELFNRIRHAVAAWKIKPVHVSIFGSTARGDGDTASDIDLFVVRPSSVDADDAGWRAQLEDIAGQIQRWTGNHTGIAEASDDELAHLHAEEPPIVAELRTDAIVLCGADVQALLDVA